MARTALLSDAIDEFDRHRKSQDFSKSTLSNHRGTLKKFLAVNGNIWCNAITDKHVTRFFEEISKTKQPQSMRNDHTALSVFFEYARYKGYMSLDVNPLWGRRKPAKVKRERNRLHVSRFASFLDAAEQRCERDRAAMSVVLYTLMRDSEIVDLRLWDLDLEAGYIKARIFKTKQEDRVPICAELDKELRRWLIYYTEQVGVLKPHYYLLPSRSTRGVQGAGGVIESIIQTRLEPERPIGALGRLAREALIKIDFPVEDGNGKPLYEGAHTIRRSGARALFDQLVADGYDRALRIVQSMLHHASSAQSEEYLGITADRRSRDDILRGQVMYALGGDVIELRRSGTDGGTENDPTGL